MAKQVGLSAEVMLKANESCCGQQCILLAQPWQGPPMKRCPYFGQLCLVSASHSVCLYTRELLQRRG